jgi:RES domain-containing protein
VVGEPPRSRIAWQPAYRIVPSRFPTIDIFERFEDPQDWDALIEVEIATNPRARDVIGDIELVPRNERLGGPGSTPIMAAFTHLHPLGTRFSSGHYGVFYAAYDRETAIDETVHHRERFLRRTGARPVDLDMRVYAVDVTGEFHDIRQLKAPEIYARDEYSAAQTLGARLREAGSNGIVYRSVRRENGECVAVFRPRRLSRCRTDRHLSYRWDGTRITVVYERRSVRRS